MYRCPEITARLYEIRKQERGLLVEFLTYLAEVDRRRLYLELGFSSSPTTSPTAAYR